jgi:hypothetical protein
MWELVFAFQIVFLKIIRSKKMERQSLIGFKEYLEKKDRIAVDISQLKKEITDTKVKSRLELEKLRVQQQLAKDISRAKASHV